jgi:hypothetical protein
MSVRRESQDRRTDERIQHSLTHRPLNTEETQDLSDRQPQSRHFLKVGYLLESSDSHTWCSGAAGEIGWNRSTFRLRLDGCGIATATPPAPR